MTRASSVLFGDLVRGDPLVGSQAIAFIRGGYSAKILKAASLFFRVPETRILKITHIPASTAARLEKKEAKIDSASSERVLRMSSVMKLGMDVFGDEESAINWMKTPNQALQGAEPLDLMDTEPGAMSVREVLNAIATGGVL